MEKESGKSTLEEPLLVVPQVPAIENASGVATFANGEGGSDPLGAGEGGGVVEKGVVQDPEYRDVPFAVAFVVQFAVVVGTAVFVGPAALRATNDSLWGEDDDDAATGSSSWTTVLSNISNLVGLFVAAAVLTMLGLDLMVKNAHRLVQISFFAAPLSFLLVAVISVVLGADSISLLFILLAIFFSCLSVCFYFCFRSQFAFAAANLRSALRGLQLNTGLYALSLGTCLLLYGSFMVWTLAFLGVQYQATNFELMPCQDLGRDDDTTYPGGSMCYPSPNIWVVGGLLLTFFWTQQVIQNVLHTTTAGTIGNWWGSNSNPNNHRCCSPSSVSSALSRSLTYSFGSICFGSLLVAIIQLLEQMAKNNRSQNGDNLLMCIIQCLLVLLRSLLEYVNSWAFVYVGLYGYDYVSAGRKVMNLFANRGWMSYISDQLVYRVLLLCNLTVGILTSGFGVVLGVTTRTADQEDLVVWYAGAGFVVGLLVSSTALFVVESAVRSVIVCFAEDPETFQDHHPELYEEMRVAWFEARVVRTNVDSYNV